MKIMEDPYPGATPEERKQRLLEVRSLIQASSIPLELKSELDKKAAAFIEVKSISGGKAHFYGGQLGWSHWVIKNDHLKLVELLAGAAIAITTYAAVATAAPAVMAVTLLFGVVALADRLKDKAASLDETSYKLVMTLKQIGPATPAKLAEALNGISIFGSHMWTESTTNDALRGLQQVRLGDGSTEALVNQASDGLWSTNGI
jgi:hypothetical protein